jgi:dTDP-4-dehydrorhamnose reductase
MKPVRLLILGAGGMLGHKLFGRISQSKAFEVYGTVRSSNSLSAFLSPALNEKIISGVDAWNFDSIIRVISSVKPDVLINCIGIIKQLPAARDYLSSISINALLPHRIAEVCQAANTRMIHISTDCVFDGKQGNYCESDIPNPLDLYGRSKLLGEVDYPHCLTLRTSIIGHELSGKNGLLEWFLSQKESIEGYSYHIYSGFPTVELADIISRYIIPRTDIRGIYQISSEPVSKYELLRLIASRYKKKIKIIPNTQVYCDRSLNSSRMQKLCGYYPPSWPELIDRMYLDYVNSPYKRIARGK